MYAIIETGGKQVKVAVGDKIYVEKLGVETKVIEIRFKVGDSVRICDGMLNGFIGLVESISDDKKKVTVSASLFGRETKVELDVTQVKTLDE